MFRRIQRTLLRSDVPLQIERLALCGATVGVFIVLAYAFVRYGDSSRAYFLYYNVPIAAPFAAFLIERMSTSRGGRVLIDTSIVTMALARIAVPVPGYSGHALFLTFALLTARSVGLRILAALVLGEVVAIKLLLWGDYVTVAGSATLAVIASVIYRRLPRPISQPPVVQDPTARRR